MTLDKQKTFQLRPVNPEIDFPRMAELRSQGEPDAVTVEDLQRALEQTPAERIQQRMAAIDEQGLLVGFHHIWRDPWMVPGRFFMLLFVDLPMRQQGIGGSLYASALAFAQEHGATNIQAIVRDDSPEALHFAQERGFQIERHLFESTLDLATFDEKPFAGVVEVCEASGIRFFTLADLGNTREAQHRVYEVAVRYSADEPGRNGPYLPFEQFQKYVFDSPYYRAEGQIIAALGEDWIGTTALRYFPTTNSLYNMMTCVDPALRGRKIALAMKLLVIRYAQRSGAAYLMTHNDSENAPMLAINRKLGYKPKPGRYLLSHKLPEQR